MAKGGSVNEQVTMENYRKKVNLCAHEMGRKIVTGTKGAYVGRKEQIMSDHEC